MALSIKNRTEAYLKVLGSLFHYAAIPLMDDPEKAIAAFKDEYPKASHYPFAYVHEGKERCSDDGEPSGVAGLAYLSLLRSRGLDEVLLICARYFGGTELGVGRLKRTFFEGIKQALDKAEVGEILYLEEAVLEVPFEISPSLENALRHRKIEYRKEERTNSVSLTFLLSDRISKVLEGYPSLGAPKILARKKAVI